LDKIYGARAGPTGPKRASRPTANRTALSNQIDDLGSTSGWRYEADKSHCQAVADLRFRRQVEHLHRLGRRPTAEFLAELGANYLIRQPIEQLLDRYSRLDPAAVRAVGADKFAAAPIHLVDEGEP
jgi:hypothetical protein